MGALTQAELYKYAKGTSRDRVPIFIRKLTQKEPFTLMTGQKVVLEGSLSLISALEKRQNLKPFALFDAKGKLYKFSQLKKTSEFGGAEAGIKSGSGAGSDVTGLTESAQALYASAKWKRSTEYTDDDLKRASPNTDISDSVNDIIKKLSPAWRQSCILGAERLFQEFGGKNYKFHRQSNWVRRLESHFKKLNAESDKYFSNVNKWSPADIWIISDAGQRIDLLKTTSLVELNSKLKEALDSKDIIGVSLKQIVGKVKFSYVNYGEKKPPVKYEGYIVSKKNFWGAKDVYINYTVKGEVQFRTFTASLSGWQGEIKGEHASHGKISYGICERIFKQLKSRKNLPPVAKLKIDFESNDEKLLKNFWELYKKFDEKDNPKLKFTDFISEFDKKGAEKFAWGFSKYLGLYILDIITEEHLEDQFVSKAVEYATSTSDLSAPFVKME